MAATVGLSSTRRAASPVNACGPPRVAFPTLTVAQWRDKFATWADASVGLATSTTPASRAFAKSVSSRPGNEVLANINKNKINYSRRHAVPVFAHSRFFTAPSIGRSFPVPAADQRPFPHQVPAHRQFSYRSMYWHHQRRLRRAAAVGEKPHLEERLQWPGFCLFK